MLDRSKVAKELSLLVDKLFIDCSKEYEIARNVWNEIAIDPTFVYKVREVDAPWPIPTWEGSLNQAIEVKKNLADYHILSVDGSQVYPDRHQGLSCYLINIGGVALHYGLSGYRASFNCMPYVYTGDEDLEQRDISTDMVNCRRQDLELQDGFKQAKLLITEIHDGAPFLLLFDGSLIFWHLDAKEPHIKDMFLSRYLATLHQLYAQEILTASYISMPKSKELVNLVRLALCEFQPERQERYKVIDHVVDATIAHFFLEPYQRSILFKNQSKISQLYPDHLHPYFFYLHVGNEIGRVEIPAWVAQDQQAINTIAAIVLDQCIKGRGYPVAIAEAHEQAVVKGPDRDFFYHLVCKIGIDRKQRLALSQKILRKRSIGI